MEYCIGCVYEHEKDGKVPRHRPIAWQAMVHVAGSSYCAKHGIEAYERMLK